MRNGPIVSPLMERSSPFVMGTTKVCCSLSLIICSISRFSIIIAICRQRDQQVAELDRRSIADAFLVLSADHRHHSDAAGFLVAMSRERNWRQAWFAPAPAQFGQIDPVCVEPCRFIGHVAVAALFDAARPAAFEVRRDPSAMTWRWVEPEGRPSMACLGM